MTAYVSSIKGSCNTEEGFPEGALGITALAVSRRDLPGPTLYMTHELVNLRLSVLSLHIIAATGLCLVSSRERTASLV